MDRTEFLIGNEVPIILIDNLYSEEELELIWEELNFLTYSQKLQAPEKTGSAFDDDEDKTLLKNNSGLFLDCIWNRELSNILKVNRKIFWKNMEVITKSSSWFYKSLRCTRDTTLLSYYEDSDYYKPHHDLAYVTVLNWYFKEPKRFTGGDLKIHYEDNVELIEIKNNRTIIFPSNIKHEVTPVSMEEQYRNQKLGRYCITQFLSHAQN